MELVYLWIEEYKNIKNQGFNFSPRFEFHYDKGLNELTKVRDESSTYKSIFPDNINITAIVGENGSGKSSIIENIFKFLDCIPLEKRSIVIYYDHKKYVCITDIENIIIDKNITYIKRNEHHICSNLFVYNQKYNHQNSLYRNYRTISIDKKGVINTLVYNFNQTIDFYLKDFMFQPNKIRIKYKDEESIIDLFRNMSSSIEDFINMYEEQEPYKKFLITLCAKKGIDDISFYNDENKMISRIGLSEKELKELHINFNKLIAEREFEFKKENRKAIELYIRREYFDLFEFDLIDDKGRKYNNLSHGEQVLFGLLLSISFHSNNDSGIFLLDEPELSLHPQWQKKFLNEMISLLKQFSEKQYQIILTSHSPFILSDLPRENVIFLKNGKQKKPFKEDEQTFSANIHTLLSHGFFMEDGLMGEFAKQKIEEIFDYLKENKSLKTIKEENVESIIRLIGEDFLREKLLNMYKNKFNVKSNEEKIKELEKEIKRLKNASN